MKRKTFIPVVLLAAFMLTAFTYAQDINRTYSENAVNTLIKGIKSDNEGLSRSSIYFAGKYKIAEEVERPSLKRCGERAEHQNFNCAFTLSDRKF